MKARVFPAVMEAVFGGVSLDKPVAVRTRPLSPKDWAEKLADAATVTLAIPGGVETYEILATHNGRLMLWGKPLGKFGPGDEVSFYHGGEAYTFEVHRVSARKVTLWPR